MHSARALLTYFTAFLLVELPLVVAHGDDAAPAMAMAMGGAYSGQRSAENDSAPLPVPSFAPNYFNHPEHKSWMYAHIALMMLAWTVVLPVDR